jgi:hypothetical protein
MYYHQVRIQFKIEFKVVLLAPSSCYVTFIVSDYRRVHIFYAIRLCIHITFKNAWQWSPSAEFKRKKKLQEEAFKSHHKQQQQLPTDVKTNADAERSCSSKTWITNSKTALLKWLTLIFKAHHRSAYQLKVIVGSWLYVTKVMVILLTSRYNYSY